MKIENFFNFLKLKTMPIQDLKKIIPSYFKDVWYLNPEFLFELSKSSKEKTDPQATTSLNVYKQFYK